MIKTYWQATLLLLVLGMMGAAEVGAAKPHVVILATGGTIAGAAESAVDASYTAAKVPVDELVRAVPQINDIARISAEQVVQIASQAMSSEIWLTLARRVDSYVHNPDVTGVVITHGTDTLEETAYFLDLVIDSDKPIVLVGSMRPPTGLGADGDLNLYNAVALAASAEARGRGVLVAMNETIHAARYVTKTHTTAVQTFVARGKGPLGHIHQGQVTFYQRVEHTGASPFNIHKLKKLPVVDILYGYANASAVPVEALVASGSQGIVYAGVGNGNLFPAVENALIAARKQGVLIVRSSRTGSGHVLRNAEVDDDKWDFIVADDLSPQKARILLMLALTRSRDTAKLQQWFYKF